MMLPLSLLAAEKIKLSDFKGNYYFVYSHPKNKEGSGKVSSCLKLETAQQKKLSRYKSCVKSQDEGFPGSLGKCQKDDSDKIYFYSGKQTCENAQADAVSGANS